MGQTVVNTSPDNRPRRPGVEWVGIVIHHTGLPNNIPSDKSTWDKYTKNVIDWLSKKDDVYVSSHFIIDREGKVLCLVNPETHVAFHAGKSKYWNPQKRGILEGCNDFMIGIELIGDGNRIEYTELQYVALGHLCKDLIKRFDKIQPHCIVGHEMVSPGRKADPGILFDWKRFFTYIYSSRLA